MAETYRDKTRGDTGNLPLVMKYGINRVILFGSGARGDYKRVSDIDLAVSGKAVIRFTLDVEEQTSMQLMSDIVDLNGPVQEELLVLTILSETGRYFVMLM